MMCCGDGGAAVDIGDVIGGMFGVSFVVGGGLVVVGVFLGIVDGDFDGEGDDAVSYNC